MYSKGVLRVRLKEQNSIKGSRSEALELGGLDDSGNSSGDYLTRIGNDGLKQPVDDLAAKHQ